MADSSKLKNPFVGLRAFEEHEDYLFFGRRTQINDLLKKFSSSRFLAVIGSSGSGKSSLVKSGLLPAIYSGFLSIGRNWRVALLRPGNDPIGNMAQELSSEGVLYENTKDSEIPYHAITASTLRRSGGGLVQVYREAHLAPTENLLIVIDQFEELFRFSKYEAEANEGKSDALSFINLLLTAAQQRDYPVYVLLTMRSDFIGDCAQFRGLPEAINDGQYLVPRMTRDEIREAITGPIAVGGAQIAPRLVTRLLNDVGNNLDQLPILQHAMMRTWDAWQKKNKPALPIDIEDYEKIGGMSTALNQHAEEAYAELTTDKQRLICELMFKALTDKAADVRGIRRPTSVEDLCKLTKASTVEVIQVVEVFRKTGRTFLMPPPGVLLNNKSIIDISHESIMRVWQRLIKWTDEEAQSAEVYLRLSEAAQFYEQGKTNLWRNPDLEIGLKWYHATNPNATWAERYNENFKRSIAFLLNSEKQEIKIQEEKEASTRNKRRIAIGAIVVLTLFSIIAFSLWRTAVVKTREAESQKRKAEHSDTLAQNALIVARIAQKSDSISRLKAEENEKIAYEAKRSDSLSAIEARHQRDIAIHAKKREEDEKKIVIKEKIHADSLAKVNAVAYYQKLIREGPIEKDLIREKHFDFKLIAYHVHLVDSLRAKEKEDELYGKLYYCLKARNLKFVIDTTNVKLTDTTSIGNKSFAYAKNNKLYMVYEKSGQNTKDSILFNNTISAIAADPAARKLFVATKSKDITILNYDAAYDTSTENKIVLGGVITAIDYYSDQKNSIIFFGLQTGETGYINYSNKNERKYQPVYRNDLEWPVTAVNFFKGKSDGRYYLVATNSKGNAVVYESDTTNKSIQNYLNPDTKLIEIKLPDNYGPIKNAKYDVASDRIIFRTTKFNYRWNPFTEQLLKELKTELDGAELSSMIKKTKFY